jgi:alginate O-acetyltransferase complex protein AlgI
VVFTSYEFVLVFLPIIATVVLGLSASGRRTAAKSALFAGSLIFYAWWNPRYVPLLLAILTFNFVTGTWLISSFKSKSDQRRRRHILTIGILVNVGILIYFKYTNFLVRELNDHLGLSWEAAQILLPLGISFITFQKIAFLVDAYNGEIEQLRFLDYAVFVTFFPQLISGPIVHHREVISQLQSERSLRFSSSTASLALAFFVIGAFKKLVLADSLSSHVATGFEAAAHGGSLGFGDAWISALAYTFQVYFDFSGYSDIAIGLALLFGVRLPFNFNSPLKSSGPIDYWGRWHITLTRFLTAYIYNPIALRISRRRIRERKAIRVGGVMTLGAFGRLVAVPTMFTMAIAGAWHGAGYQFIVFGLIHGVYLVGNHAWRNLRPVADDDPTTPSRLAIPLGRVAMFIGAVAAIPFFRADSVASGLVVLKGMLGFAGRGMTLLSDPTLFEMLAVCLLVSQCLPNTQEFLGKQLDAAIPKLEKHKGEAAGTRGAWSWPRISWSPTIGWAIVIGIVGWYVMLRMAKTSEFLYFQF